jgi:hypothetical protein
VDQEPRPLVLAGPAAVSEEGFRSGPAKLAFLYGHLESTVPLPPGLLEVLGAGATRQPRPGPRHNRGPLLITGATKDHGVFTTDRGRRSLPAWRLTGPDLLGPLWVLDPAIAATCWTPPEDGPPPPFQGASHRADRATLGDDGRTLRLAFIGGPPGYIEYPTVEVIDSDHAVVLLPVEHDSGPPGLRAWGGSWREVAVTLNRPLGHRVLVELDASPVMVQAPGMWGSPVVQDV